MKPLHTFTSTPNARTLLFSHRNIYEPAVWRSALREFENLIFQLDDADLCAPLPQPWYPKGKSVALRIGRYKNLPLNPGIAPFKLNKKYDLFFAVCEKPSELLHLKAVKGLFDKCKTTVCWLPEFYVKDMDMHRSCLEVLSRFSYVIFMYDNYDPFLKVINGKGFYQPSGIDAIRFSPYPHPPQRSIDVLSIGRRSNTTHLKLYSMMEKSDNFFYLYDTINHLRAHSVEEHRFLFSKIAKRTKYFIVNPGKIDSPEETGGQVEFGYRYVEGAAPGAIMIGEIPNNRQFKKLFNYPDAVIHLPYGAAHIDELILELESKPDRCLNIRKNNITNCLENHDWAYRWEKIISLADLKPTKTLLERKAVLRSLAEIVRRY